MKRYHWMSNSQHVRNMSCGLQTEKRCSRRCKWFVKGFKRNAWFPHLLMPINKWSKEVSADPLLTDWPTFLRRDSFHWIVRVSRHSFKTFNFPPPQFVFMTSLLRMALPSKSIETHFENSWARKDKNTAISCAVWKLRCLLFLSFFSKIQSKRKKKNKFSWVF